MFLWLSYCFPMVSLSTSTKNLPSPGSQRTEELQLATLLSPFPSMFTSPRLGDSLVLRCLNLKVAGGRRNGTSSGRWMGDEWEMNGMIMERWMGCVWKMNGMWMEDEWDVNGRSVGYSRDIDGMWMGYSWVVHGICGIWMGYSWDMNGMDTIHGIWMAGWW